MNHGKIRAVHGFDSFAVRRSTRWLRRLTFLVVLGWSVLLGAPAAHHAGVSSGDSKLSPSTSPGSSATFLGTSAQLQEDADAENGDAFPSTNLLVPGDFTATVDAIESGSFSAAPGSATSHAAPFIGFAHIFSLASGQIDSKILVSPGFVSGMPSNSTLTGKAVVPLQGATHPNLAGAPSVSPPPLHELGNTAANTASSVDLDIPADAFSPEFVNPVPEPSTLILLGSGVVALAAGAVRRRHFRR